MKIDKYINELLYDHDCVIITDMGGFIANYKAASVNEALHVIAPPSKHLAFNSSLKNNDGLLAAYISRQNAINYIDACVIIKDFVTQAVGNMQAGQKLKLEKLGVLFIDRENNIQFIPDQHANYLTASFGMNPVHSPLIKREAPYEIPKKKRDLKIVKISRKKERKIFGWKIFEVVPAAAILALLLIVPPALNQFNTNLSSMLPFSRINEYIHEVKGEKNSTVPKINYRSPFENTTVIKSAPLEDPFSVKTTDTASTTVDLNPEPSIPVESKTELKVEIAEPAPDAKIVNSEAVAENNSGTAKNYFVIGGAFRHKANAIKYTDELKAKGVEAQMIGRNQYGFYLVSVFESENRLQVMDALSEFKSTIVAGAWVFKK